MLETPAPPLAALPATAIEPAAAKYDRPRRDPRCNRIGNRAARRRRAQIDGLTSSPALDWVRRSLRFCDLLASVQSISPTGRVLVGFAIEWAPYGGADAEELFIKFGIARERFLHLLKATMPPRPSDLNRLRAMKATLCDDLLRAWQTTPTGSGK
ncbi:hypothetical protein ACFWAY_48970 [Rhodococcus sp. NPDC059968]|uniref:hypothetical protein n=1 Tax=Rhodococcus sp. NPDC059968 TaxID=3347017 RepID=UPI00366EA85C